jgi:hypothetical protein
MKKLRIVALMIIFISCSTAREDVVLEAFTEPVLDWYSLKLYSDGRFDLHIPAIDYRGTYKVSGDTVFLKSIEVETARKTIGPKTKGVVKEQRWTFLIDSKTRKVRTIGNADSQTISIDIIENKL